MNNTSETMMCKAKKALKSLFGASIEKNYDLTLSLYPDGDTQNPSCSHHFKGSSRHSIVKAVALGGVIAVILSTVGSICSCMRDK